MVVARQIFFMQNMLALGQMNPERGNQQPVRLIIVSELIEVICGSYLMMENHIWNSDHMHSYYAQIYRESNNNPDIVFRTVFNGCVSRVSLYHYSYSLLSISLEVSKLTRA